MGDVQSLLNDAFEGDDIHESAKQAFEQTKSNLASFSEEQFDKAEDAAAGMTNAWASLTTAFNMFGFDSVGRAAAREVLLGTLGPPPRPELVEEAVLAAILEIQPRVVALSDPMLEGALKRLDHAIACARSCGNSDAVRALLSQDKYRTMVRRAVEENWKSIKGDVKASVKHQVLCFLLSCQYFHHGKYLNFAMIPFLRV